jgi:hypothetical protein
LSFRVAFIRSGGNDVPFCGLMALRGMNECHDSRWTSILQKNKPCGSPTRRNLSGVAPVLNGICRGQNR